MKLENFKFSADMPLHIYHCGCLLNTTPQFWPLYYKRANWRCFSVVASFKHKETNQRFQKKWHVWQRSCNYRWLNWAKNTGLLLLSSVLFRDTVFWSCCGGLSNTTVLCPIWESSVPTYIQDTEDDPQALYLCHYCLHHASPWAWALAFFVHPDAALWHQSYPLLLLIISTQRVVSLQSNELGHLRYRSVDREGGSPF